MQFKIKIFIVGSVLSVLMFTQGCQKTWDEHYNTLDATTEKDKIISEMEKIPDISKFTEAVKSIDTLADILNQNRLYTVFAPVNETFDQIDPEILNNDYLFTIMVLNHFINGKYKYKDFSNELLTTFNMKFLDIRVDAASKVLIDSSATIINQDFLSQNGMIQVIDLPLVPLKNLNEYFNYNAYTNQFGTAIPNYDIKNFVQSASTPIGENENGELIYDSVFYYTNPFLSNAFVNPPVSFYGKEIRFFNDITNENDLFTFVFPENYQSAFDAVKNSSFLNSPIADHDWVGPILSWWVINDLLSPEMIISEIEEYHAEPNVDTVELWLYLVDLLKNNYTGKNELSNGMVYLVDGFEYDPGWLITNQGSLKYGENESNYQKSLISAATISDNIDTVLIEFNNIKSIFFQDTSNTGYESKYGESIDFELIGDFYPVDYKILVRGRNFASGTYKIEADGKEIGNYNFSTAPSGDLDTQFDEIGTISFTETKSISNLKFTFIGTHPETNKGEQYLWIREIKLSPIIK